ncbi:MAG: polyprenyl synthetase family protein [Planctomycetota bacterium]
MTDIAATFDKAAFKESMSGLIERVNAAMPTLLPPDNPFISDVHEASLYSLLGGGKRIRPLLVMLTCEAAGGTIESAVPIGCAWEFVHTYSLVHDDLPAMDNDRLRRGRPTTWVQYGEALAILAADGLLTEAFAIIATHSPTAAIARDLVRELANAAGIRGMVGGQAADIRCEGAAPDAGNLRFIHEHKTGALLKSAVRAGARLGGAEGDVLAALDEYGDALGLAFQVVDDMLDATSTDAELGKTAGKDAEQQKLTYLSVYGLERSREIADELIGRALAAVEPLGARGAKLAQLALYVRHRSN